MGLPMHLSPLALLYATPIMLQSPIMFVIEITKILCGQLNVRCTTCGQLNVHRTLSCPQRIFVVSMQLLQLRRMSLHVCYTIVWYHAPATHHKYNIPGSCHGMKNTSLRINIIDTHFVPM